MPSIKKMPYYRHLITDFSPDGEFFEFILSYPALDFGTKLMYIERAIIQDTLPFLQTLDRLYQPNLEGDAEIINLLLIRHLKLLHDFCHNNVIYTEADGYQNAIPYCFEDSTPIVVDDFKATLVAILRQGIRELQEGYEAEVAAQQQARQEIEIYLARNQAWRAMMRLPEPQWGDLSAQEVEMIKTSSTERFQARLREALTASGMPDTTLSTLTVGNKKTLQFASVQTLLANGQLTWSDALGLEFGHIRLLCDPSVRQFMDAHHISITKFIRYDNRKLQNLGSKKLRELVNNEEISLKDALSLDPYTCSYPVHRWALENPAIRQFMQHHQITMPDLISYNYYQTCNLLSTTVRDLVTAGQLSWYHAKKLSSSQRRVLKDPVARAFMEAHNITLTQLCDNAGYAHNVGSALIQELVSTEQMPIAVALKLGMSHRKMLKDPALRQFLTEQGITLHAFAAMDYTSLSNLQSSAIRQLIASEQITLALALTLTTFHRMTLQKHDSRQFLQTQQISLTEFAAFHLRAASNIGSTGLCELVTQGEISLETMKTLNDSYVSVLNNPKGRQFLIDHHITIAEFITMSESQAENLACKRIRALVTHKQIPLDVALLFNQNQREQLIQALYGYDAETDYWTRQAMSTKKQLNHAATLVLQDIIQQTLIDAGYISLEQVNELNNKQRKNIRSIAIRKLIIDGAIPIGIALTLKSWQRRFLEDPTIYPFINDHAIPVPTIATLNKHQAANLSSVSVRTLIIAGKLTLDAAWKLSPLYRTLLDDPAVQQFINEHAITLHADNLDILQNIGSATVRSLVTEEKMTLDVAMRLTLTHRALLDTPGVLVFMTDNQLLPELLTYQERQRLNVSSELIRELVSSGQMSITAALALTPSQRYKLEAEHAQAVVPPLLPAAQHILPHAPGIILFPPAGAAASVSDQAPLLNPEDITTDTPVDESSSSDEPFSSYGDCQYERLP